jgi:UDP-glucose 4-epimerase
MKILVTGGAGCIGSDLAAALLEQGHTVTAYDNLSSGKSEHIEALKPHPRFRFVEADMLDRPALSQAVAGQEMVYHLAANPDVKYSPGDPTTKDLEQNTLATHGLLDEMRLAGVKRLAFSSTSAVYGISERLPIPEDQPMKPISLYGATKLSCEATIAAFQNLFEMQCWVFRFANIVGDKVRKRGRTVISDFIYKLQQNPAELEILGNGQQAKSYLLSQDCVNAMLYCVEHAREGYNVFNLGCDDQLSVNEIARMVCEALGLADVRFRYTGGEGGWPGDVPQFKLDVSRLNKLGWRASRGSREAVGWTIGRLVEQRQEVYR